MGEIQERNPRTESKNGIQERNSRTEFKNGIQELNPRTESKNGIQEQNSNRNLQLKFEIRLFPAPYGFNEKRPSCYKDSLTLKERE